MSPEYILSVDFNDDVLRKEQFRQQLTAVAIDELHLVNDWRNFRCEFSELHVLRSRLPVHVPYLGVSATLDKKTLSIVRKDAGFDDCQLLKTSIDRPEISTYIIFMEGNQNNFEDLRRFFPINLESPPYDIPKTVFYFDSKIKLNSFIRLATDVWFPEWGYPAEAYRWIAGYHADMAEWDKQRLSSIFERPDCPEDSTQGSPIRFWGASEAYGTGADNPDIKNIINYLIPKNENAHAQRKGRLVRKGGKGKFFMVVPRWACTTADLSKNYARKNKPNQNPTLDSYIPEQTNDQYDSDQSDDSITQSQPVTGAALNQARALQREKEVPEYIELINSSCNRVCELKRYDDETYPGYESGVLSKPDSCCSGCNPTSEDIPAYRPYPSISKSDNFSEAYLTKKLTQWRNEKARLLYEKSHIPMSGASILSDRFLKRIVQHNTFILNPTALAQQCKDWTEREVYEEEIVAMCTAIRDRSPGTNIHDAWREQVYSKQQETARNKGHSVDVKGRPVLPVVETEKEILIRKRNERKSAWLIGMGLPVVDKPAKSRKSKAKASTSDSSQSTTSSSSQQELLGTANASAASRNQSSSQSQIERRPLSALSINTVRRLSQQSKGSSPSRSSRS